MRYRTTEPFFYHKKSPRTTLPGANCSIPELLDNSNTSDNGDRLHLALGSGNDSIQHCCKGNQSEYAGDYSCENSAYEWDNAENSANSAYNSFNYKQDKTLVCMKLGERTVSGNKCNDEKRSKITEHAQSLFGRIHKYYLL